MAGVPRSVLAQYALSQRLQAAAQLRARRLWTRVGQDHMSESWGHSLAAGALVANVAALQILNAEAGASYGAEALADQGLMDPVQAFVNPEAFGGYTGAGTPLNDALFYAVPHAKGLIAQGLSPDVALRRAGLILESQVKTAVADAGRQAAGVDNFTRRRTGYVRMLNTPSCSRCVMLAGKFYRHNEGFLRHAKCDCIHIPTQENEAGSVTTDPYAYFESLDEGTQDRVFTKAGAQAIRDGSDMFQVMNSRSGMSYNGTARDGSNRGLRANAYTKAGRGRMANYAGPRKRLTPEAIYAQGLPRADTLRMLERYGYVLPGGQDPEGILAPRRASKGVMTAAEKRVQDATLNWKAVQEGRHPQSGRKLTPADAARYENAYRTTVARRGQKYLPGE